MNSNLQKTCQLIDLTRLNDTDTNGEVIEFAKRALQKKFPPKTFCIFPQYIPVIRNLAKANDIGITTVIDFPVSHLTTDEFFEQFTASVQDGADEIDIVFPYGKWLEGAVGQTANYLQTATRAKDYCKNVFGKDIILKVIMETGEFSGNDDSIYHASLHILKHDIDFLKTSTGKTNIGATPHAVKQMLHAIKISPGNAGCKISGGVRTPKDAQFYMSITEDIMGVDFIKPETFRFGASALYENLFSSEKAFDSAY